MTTASEFNAVISQDLNNIKQSLLSLHTGVSYMTALISAAVTFVVGGGLGWWFGKRGTAGVQTDLNTVKTDVENLKAKVGG